MGSRRCLIASLPTWMNTQDFFSYSFPHFFAYSSFLLLCENSVSLRPVDLIIPHHWDEIVTAALLFPAAFIAFVIFTMDVKVPHEAYSFEYIRGREHCSLASCSWGRSALLTLELTFQMNFLLMFCAKMDIFKMTLILKFCVWLDTI